MKQKLSILILVIAIVIAACSLTPASNNGNQVDQGAIETQVAETMAAVAAGQNNGQPSDQQPGDQQQSGDQQPGDQQPGDQQPANTDIPTFTPEPTNTPEPTATPTIEPTLPSGIDALNLGNPDVRYTFDNKNGIYTFGGSDNKTEVKNGKYEFTMVDDISYTVWSFPFAKVLEDYYFEVAITMPDDCHNKDKAGIIFGTPDKETDNGINYQISCDGHYRLWIYDGSETTYLINWTSSDELHSGAGKTNKIGVMHRGQKISLYINGVLVDQISDDSYVGPGRIGFNIGIDNHHPVTFKFDDAAYWTNLP